VLSARFDLCWSIIARCLSGVNQNLDGATQAALGVTKLTFPKIDQAG
jgi:hypothetical protein